MSHLIPSDPDVRPFLVARSARSVAVWRFSDPLGRVGPGDTQLAREDGLGFPLGALLLLDLHKTPAGYTCHDHHEANLLLGRDVVTKDQ